LKGINLVADQELKNTINSVHQELKGQHFFETQNTDNKIVKMRNRNSRWDLIAVAATMVLVAATWWALKQDERHEANTQELYAEYYQADDPDIISIIGTGFVDQPGSRDDLFEEALKLFKNKNFRAANKTLQMLDTKFPDDNEIKLYLALSNIELGNVNTAIDQLRPLTIADFDMQAEAQWYLGLLLMNDTDNKQEAMDLFNTLAKGDTTKYQERAEEILKELKASK